MKNYIITLLKNLLFQIIFFIILFWTVAFAAISWPSSIPNWENVWGIFTQYFENIEWDCQFWYVLEWFDNDFNKICKEVILIKPCIVTWWWWKKEYYNGSRSDCEVTRCTTDYYRTSTSVCSPVWNWYFSTSTSISRIVCTNKPSNSYYTSDGNWINNCSFSCNTNYTWNWSSCIADIQTCTVTGWWGTKTWLWSSWSSCNVTWCITDYYRSSTSVCTRVWTWYYSSSSSIYRYSCTNYPDTASRNYTYTTDWNWSNSCSASYTAKCWTDTYESSNWVCSRVWVWYYSPSYNNSKYSCTNKPLRSYYSSDGNWSNSCNYTCSSWYSGVSCTPIISCWIDLYESTPWICSAVWTWYYSPSSNNTKYSCSNKPTYSYYISDWNWINNCNYTCNSGYHLSSWQCLSNIISCYIANWTWQKVWNWSSRWECTVVSCNSGYDPSDPPPPPPLQYTATFPWWSWSNCWNQVFSWITSSSWSYSWIIKYYDHGRYTKTWSWYKAQWVTSVSAYVCINQWWSWTLYLTLD